jgi:hypothetical protein
MKRIFTAVAIIVFTLIVNQSSAQNAWRLGIAGNAGIASNKIYGLVLGADVRLQTKFDERNLFILTSGLTHFFDTQKTIDGFTYVPLKAGFKTFFVPKLYVAAEAGVGFGLNKGSDASFLWSPSFGYSGKKLDVSIKYEDFTEVKYLQQVALRIAYGFKL